MVIGLGLLAITNGEITEWDMYGLRFDLQKNTETLFICRARDKPSFTNQIQYGVPSGAAGGGTGKDPEWPESHRFPTNYSSTIPFGEAIFTCAAAASTL